ncbi:MAG: 4Fe-4S dicluster-binding protein [Candidatus Hydrothermarchaeales archaeon]
MKVSVSITDVGNTIKTKTGGWRTFKPVFEMEKCIDCGNCWIYCPDSSIIIDVKDGKRVYSANMDYCKGCGICANECPTEAIEMVLEEK